MYLERDKFGPFRERVENMRKHFFNEASQANLHPVAPSPPSAPSVPTVTRARSLDHSSSNSRNELAPSSTSGFSRSTHGQLVSDPWSEEAPSGGVFSLDHIEKPLTRYGSLGHSRPSTPGSRVVTPDFSVTGESSKGSVENNSSVPPGMGRPNPSQAGSSTYTPPHLRDRSIVVSSGQSTVATSLGQLPSLVTSLGQNSSLSSSLGQNPTLATSLGQLPSLEGRSGSYAPPHLRLSNSFNATTSPTGLSGLRHELESSASGDFGSELFSGNSPRDSNNGHSLLPYGSSDFLDFNPEPEISPTYSTSKKIVDQVGQSETVKPVGTNRQPGMCAVCNRDAANTVRAFCTLTSNDILVFIFANFPICPMLQ